MKHLSFPISSSALRGALFGFALASVLAFKWGGEKPGCAIQLGNQNTICLGVDNPVTILVRGFPEEEVKIEAEGMTLKKSQDNYRYIAHATEAGEASITVSAGNLKQQFRYRVKRMPDPLLCLGANPQLRGGSIGNGEFKAQGGLAALAENIDWGCMKIGMESFQITYISKSREVVVATNAGKMFTPEARALIDRAKPGDVYFFSEAMVRCPGEKHPRLLGPLKFSIK